MHGSTERVDSGCSGLIDPGVLARASPIERVSFAGVQTVERCIQERRPALIAGGLADWPALSKWSLDYFIEKWGDRSLRATVKLFEKGKAPYASRGSEMTTTGTFREFAERMRADDPSNPVYVNQKDADLTFPGSREDLCYGALLDGAGELKPNVWLGTRGTRSGLHWDDRDNLITVFEGGKAFVLAPPGAYAQMYASNENYSKSQLDPALLDADRFPRALEVPFIVGVVRRGDILFLPQGWWHYFAALELTMNTSIWFGERLKPRFSEHYGLGYLSTVAWQFAWHGVLGRPFERRSLSPPPAGVMVYDALATKLRMKPRIP